MYYKLKKIVMGFLVFLWNLFVKMVTFIGFLAIEIGIFAFLYKTVSASAPVLAGVLLVVFIIWIIVEIIIRIFVGTSINIIKYIFGRFF